MFNVWSTVVGIGIVTIIIVIVIFLLAQGKYGWFKIESGIGSLLKFNIEAKK